MKLNWVLLDFYDDRYIIQFQFGPICKIQKQQQKYQILIDLHMTHLLDDHKNQPNQLNNNKKL